MKFYFPETRCMHKIRNICFYTAWSFRNRTIDSLVIVCYKHWQSYYGIQKRKNEICSSDPNDCSLASSSSKMLNPKRNLFSMIRKKTSSYSVCQLCCKLKNLVGKWKAKLDRTVRTGSIIDLIITTGLLDCGGVILAGAWSWINIRTI